MAKISKDVFSYLLKVQVALCNLYKSGFEANIANNGNYPTSMP